MIEIPEAVTLSNQITETLQGKSVEEVVANQSPHKFAWFYGDPEEYDAKLGGKTVEAAKAYGGHIEVSLGDIKLKFAEGINLKYFMKGEKLPKKHQLMIKFDDDSVLTASVQMYGGIWCYEEDTFDEDYHRAAKEKPSPLTEVFGFDYYKELIGDERLQNKSVKAVLATEQRIPGLGNGVLQDILFNAKIHPKRKLSSLSEDEIEGLFNAIKSTLHEMAAKGGRDTEKDLFGCIGGYTTKLSKNTVGEQCKVCGSNIVKKPYMGGSIYYCEGCQKE